MTTALRPMTEKALQAKVVECARWLRWECFHPYDSRKSREGWPDLSLWRPPRLLLVELKTETGQPSPEQCEVLEALQHCPGVECWLWRPSDWLSGEIERVLL